MIDVIRRAVVTAVQAARKLQVVQSTGVSGAAPVEGEHFEPLGVTSRPLAGAEAILAFVLGPDHPIVLAVSDRRHRPTDLQAGETAIYNCHGDRVYLRDGAILLGSASATKAVNRTGDPVTITRAANPGLFAILDAAATVATLPPVNSISGTTGAGSSVVKAVD